MISMFKIVALSPEGEDALKKNLNEWKKVPPQVKLMWKALMKRETSFNPLTFTVEIRNSSLRGMLDPKDLINKIDSAMKSEGVKPKIDYKIEVFEK